MHIYLFLPHFSSPLHFHENHAYPTRWTPLHLVPQFYSITFWRGRPTALRLKEFFLKNTYELRALMLLNFVHPESHNDGKQRRSNLSIKLIRVHSIRLFYRLHNAALLSWSFTARELHARPVVHSSTTGLDSARRTTAPETLIRLNEVAAG